ncbi:glycosyltransferase family 2 protein [Aestuariivita boseongensis]|uniref:glycosyltransferase family 2 protein n=1 Tax=Aestuariivita boseongensis TaxID=1470562 RepID=UPI00155D8E15|nr:glycosyltransferase family 2 protein [Aestuariivita boseongensis]
MSVIVTSYKQLDYIKEAVQSLVTQTVPLFEIIVVDDASQDGSIEWLREFEARHDNVIVLENEQNLTLGPTRNRGLELAQGDYVFFMDGDDMLMPQAHETWRQVIGTDPVDICIHDLRIYDQDAGQFIAKADAGTYATDHMPDWTQPSGDADIAYLMYLRPPAWRKLFRRAFVLEHALIFEPGIYEDLPIHFKALAMAQLIRTTPETLITYRKHSKSILRTPSRNHFRLLTVMAGVAEEMETKMSDRPLLLEAFRQFRFGLMHFTCISHERILDEDRVEFVRQVLDVPGLTAFSMSPTEKAQLSELHALVGQDSRVANAS